MLSTENSRKRLFLLLLGLYLAQTFYAFFEYSDTQVHIHRILFSSWPAYAKRFAVFDLSDMAFKALLICGIACSVALAAGYKKAFIPIALWIIFTGIWIFNPLARTVYAGFAGWCLLAILFFDTPEELTLARYSWYLFGFVYTLSGIYKLTRPEWVNGSAAFLLLQSPLGSGACANFIVSYPAILKLLTWLVLAAELIALPFCVIKNLRPVIFITVVFLHFGIATFILSKWFAFGILLFNAYLMIYSEEWPKWIKRLPA